MAKNTRKASNVLILFYFLFLFNLISVLYPSYNTKQGLPQCSYYYNLERTIDLLAQENKNNNKHIRKDEFEETNTCNNNNPFNNSLERENTNSNNSGVYFLLIVSPNYENEFLPITTLKEILPKLTENSISLKYYCTGSSFSQKTKFILITKSGEVLLYSIFPLTVGILSQIKDLLNKIMYAKLLYEEFKEIGN